MSISSTREEARIRPMSIAEYKGQDSAKKGLDLYIKAAKIRNEPLDHLLIYGPSGLGKTTLAGVVAEEMGCVLKTIPAPTLKTINDMIELLMGLEFEENYILFIDEIHRLPIKLEEILYFAMEDFVLRTKSGTEPLEVKLPKFTLIGATTRSGMLSEPLRNRFGITIELRPYALDDLTDIVMRSANILGTKIGVENARTIASRSRGIPRVANGFLRRARDFAMVLNDGVINEEVVQQTFDIIDVDEKGLTRQDRQLLLTLINRFKFGPVGLSTLCSAINDDQKTIEATVEPYLIQIGMLERTPRGRVATQLAYDFLVKGE